MAESTVDSSSRDPLFMLPSELVLRIIEFASIKEIAALTRLNRAWNGFIDQIHQDAIYSSPSRTSRPAGAKDLSFLNDSPTFSKYYSNVTTWKDLCRRQHQLALNTLAQTPVTRESTYQIGNDPVWRFRPDFKRRIFLSTSQMGGLNVTDMDSGQLLWRLDATVVRPFAHLEYEDGTAVWDCEGDAVEVWRADQDGLPRGQFKQITVLSHKRQTRGFQLSYNTLCVVSSEGHGYVYDMAGTPTLRTTIDIPDGAVGHLDQGPDAVVYSLGSEGYHFYDKTTGASLGILQPKLSVSRPAERPGDIYDNTHHIVHPNSQLDCRLGIGNLGRTADAFPPQYPGRDRTTPLVVEMGPLPRPSGAQYTALRHDEWGAGMLDGNLFVGVSRGGRVFTCTSWRRTLQKPESFHSYSSILECDSDGANFDLGGWLSLRNHRIMFEVQDRVYVVGLDDNNNFSAAYDPEHSIIPKDSRMGHSFAFATASASQLAVPVSFMALYDDCIMSTYTTLRYRQRLEPTAPPPIGVAAPRTRILPTKIVRVLSFAPEEGDLDIPSPSNAAVGSDMSGEGREQGNGTPAQVSAMRADLYQLIAMLAGEPELEDDVEVEVGGEGVEDLLGDEEMWEDAGEGWGDGEGSDLD